MILVLTGCGGPTASPTKLLQPAGASQAVATPKPVSATQPATATQQTKPNPPTQLAGILKVHVIDIGQADSILVQFPSGQNMLVDGGNSDDAAMVVAYLK